MQIFINFDYTKFKTSLAINWRLPFMCFKGWNGNQYCWIVTTVNLVLLEKHQGGKAWANMPDLDLVRNDRPANVLMGWATRNLRYNASNPRRSMRSFHSKWLRSPRYYWKRRLNQEDEAFPGHRKFWLFDEKGCRLCILRCSLLKMVIHS